ncbi:ankyrin repeat protein [Diplodia corticola]|uniref:Ankyrin repeat protein n=1 Tax=Diplodia corticola TaxID=236234 RepID=A0A1J9S719_9PEZI|nr:ankyrin repeat protein [Diplodia corticola]OJD36311.1 ankyrin repeat protein [Diplodia corticola]
MSSSAAVADHLPPPNPSGNGEPQSVQPSLDRVRSPAPPSSPPLTDKDSKATAVRNGNHGRDAHAEQDESEAETVVLSGPEHDETKRPKKVIKHERNDDDDEISDIPSAKLLSDAAKDSIARKSPRPLAPPNGVPENKRNGANGRERAQSHDNGPASRKASSAFSSDHDYPHKNASSARILSHSPPLGHDSRARSSSVADTRKRKLRENQADLEPPRQRHKTEALSKNSRNPASPIAAGIKVHKRSASTQSLVQNAQNRRRRENIRQDKDWASDDSEESNNSSPHPQSNVPPLSRPRRGGTRSMTSPVRTLPPAKKKDAFGATRLLRCCEKGDFAAVQKAYEASPDELDSPDYAGVTPLQKASLNGHEDIVEFLLDKGCATDGHDWLDHDTPLIDATQNGHVEVIKLLLWKARVDPTYENKHFKTALALLDSTIDEADEIKAELEKAMMEWKKEKSEDESESRTPRSVEESVGPTLLPNEYNTEVLRIKSEQGDKRAVDELLASGIMPNVACGVAAARGGHDEILSFLLATGLSADHRDPAKHNETPMLVAIKKGHLNVIRLLLAQDDFDPTRRNRDGLTYWEFAEDFDGPNAKDVRNLLKEKYDERAKTKSRRLRSPEMRRTDPRSPRRKATDHESSKRTHDRETRGRPSDKSSNKHITLDNHAKPKKRLISRRELNRRSRDSTSEDSDEDEEEVRGPTRNVRRKTGHTAKVIRSSPHPSSPEQERSEARPAPAKAAKAEARPEAEPEVEPEPVKEDTPESVKQERRAEAERKAAAEKARKEEEEKEAERRAEEERARLEAERARLAAEEAERARLQAERERIQAERERQERLEKLPRALRRACEKGADRPLRFNFATKEGGIEYNFLPVHVAKNSDIDPGCPESRRDELWMMSFQVVGILGLPELDVRKEFESWECKPVSTKQLHGFLETYDISQLAEDFLFERQNWPGYNPEQQSTTIQAEKAKFLQLEPLFWVRYDDFVSATKLTKFQHLSQLEMRTARAKVTSTSTPPPTPRSWTEALFGIKPGPDFERRSKSRSVSVSLS